MQLTTERNSILLFTKPVRLGLWVLIISLLSIHQAIGQRWSLLDAHYRWYLAYTDGRLVDSTEQEDVAIAWTKEYGYLTWPIPPKQTSNTATQQSKLSITPAGAFVGIWNQHNNRWQVNPVFDSLIQTAPRCFIAKKGTDYSLIDDWGFTIKKASRHRLSYRTDSLILEHIDSTLWVYDHGGCPLIDEPIDEVKPRHEGAWVLRRGLSWGILTPNREFRPLQEEYAGIWPGSQGRFISIHRGQWGFTDQEGFKRNAHRYEAVRPYSDHRAAVKILGKWTWVDWFDNMIAQPIFDSVGAFCHGVCIAKMKGKTGLISDSGSAILSFDYDSITHAPFGGYFLHRNSLIGLADPQGKLVLHANQAWLLPSINGQTIMHFNGAGFGIVKEDGTWLSPPIFEDVQFLPQSCVYLLKRRL